MCYSATIPMKSNKEAISITTVRTDSMQMLHSKYAGRIQYSVTDLYVSAL